MDKVRKMGVKRKNNPNFELVTGANGRKYWRRKVVDKKVPAQSPQSPEDVFSGLPTMRTDEGGYQPYSMKVEEGSFIEGWSTKRWGLFPDMTIEDRDEFTMGVVSQYGVDFYSLDDVEQEALCNLVGDRENWFCNIIESADRRHYDGFGFIKSPEYVKNYINHYKNGEVGVNTFMALERFANNDVSIDALDADTISSINSYGEMDYEFDQETRSYMAEIGDYHAGNEEYISNPDMTINDRDAFFDYIIKFQGFDPNKIDPEVRGRLHSLLSSEYCWEPDIERGYYGDSFHGFTFQSKGVVKEILDEYNRKASGN